MYHQKPSGSPKRAIKGVGKTNIEGWIFTRIRVHLLLNTYPICKYSGKLGPKIVEGGLTQRHKILRALADRCSEQAANFTRLPAERIEEVVKPTGQQQSAFEKLKQTSANVADQLRASCPAQIAESPVVRFEEMQIRLNAMVQAVKALRPTLATFYASLSDEQKAQFNNLGQNTGSASGG